MSAYVHTHTIAETRGMHNIRVCARRSSFITDVYGSINNHKEIREAHLVVMCVVKCESMYVCLSELFKPSLCREECSKRFLRSTAPHLKISGN
jgi:hypothetical protein